MSDDGSTEDEKSYEVGYGKPPVHSRFKPGQSGNPRGKRKGNRSVRTILSEVLNEKVKVRTERGPKTMSAAEALIRTRMNKALKGDAKEADSILRLAREVGLSDEVAEAISAASMAELSVEDRAILARHGFDRETSG